VKNRKTTERNGGGLPLACERACDELRGRIREKWKPGARLPPIKKLARLLGAGQTSTHRAVKMLAAEGVLASRPGAGTYVTERRAAFRGPLGGASVIIRRWSDDSLFHPAADILTDILSRAGAEVRTTPYPDRPTKGDALVSGADAEVLINARTTTVEPVHDDVVLCLIETGLGCDVRGTMRYDVVSADSEQGGYQLGCLARERGEKDVLFLGVSAGRRDTYDLTSATRLQGFLRGWGGTIGQRARFRSPEYSTVEGAKAAGEYARLEKRPEFVFAASDDLAVGFIHGAWAHGLQPGQDYRLVGFDGQHRGRVIEGAQLTTVDVPMQAMGRTAANLLVERLADPDQPVRSVFLGGTLFRGDTA
jgi:hypothetical protein